MTIAVLCSFASVTGNKCIVQICLEQSCVLTHIISCISIFLYNFIHKTHANNDPHEDGAQLSLPAWKYIRTDVRS